MASKADFVRVLKQFNYSHTPEHAAELGRRAAELWRQLTPAQQANVQADDFRVRIWAAGWQAARDA